MTAGARAAAQGAAYESAPPAPPSTTVSPLAWAFWRDRGALVTGGVLLAVAALSWAGVAAQAAQMEAMGMPMLPASPGTVGDAAMFTAMWGVMMAAMMLPSALPMIALYGLVARGQRAVPAAAFAATYLVVWLLLGLPVYAAGLAVAAAAGSAAAGARWLPYGLAAVLVAAGAYQFSGVKRVCLKKCQTPLGFLMERWRAGYAATLRLGLAHAAYCVGCCWGLMVVLVAAGAMSLPWVLLVAAIVLAEKLLPRGEWTARVVGGALILLGIALAVNPALAVALRGHAMPMDPVPPNKPTLPAPLMRHSSM